MTKRRMSSLLFSLALAVSILAPQAALGGRVTDGPAPVVADAGAPPVERAGDGEADAAPVADGAGEEEQGRKRKGNAFARALTAPFRALARLFGGGGESKAHAAKKPAPPRPESTRPVEAVQNGAPEVPKPGAGDAAEQPSAQARAAGVAPVEAPKVEPVTTPAAPVRGTAEAASDSAGDSQAGGTRPPEGVRIVRPGAGEAAQGALPKMWVPLIVGVPSDPVSQGRALLQHGYIQEAIAELQVAATTPGPQLAEANNLLGLAYDRLGWHRQAAEAYGRALTVSPKDYVVLANFGYSLYLADDYAGALKRLKQAARLAPAEPVIFNNLGVVHARLGKYGEAYKNFARSSNEYEAHLKLAGILEDQRRDKEAVRHYEAALRLQPGTSAVLERLVALYERTGQRDKADTARRALGQPQRNPQRTTTGGGG